MLTSFAASPRPVLSTRQLAAWLCLLLGLLLAVAPVRAEPPTPLLWQVGEGDQHFYLLGSFHLLTKDDYPLADSLEAAYAGAERVVFELAPEAALSPTLAATMTQRGMLPADQSLTGMVSEETRAGLIRFLGSEAALPSVERFKPWFLSLGIAISAMTQSGFEAQLGLDMHLMQRAQADGKATGGLETAEDQINALDSVPFDEQEISLRQSLRPLPELRSEIDTLHRYWREANVDGLEREMLNEMIELTPKSAKLLTIDRNLRWLPQVQAMVADGQPTLVVVGALHLIGDDGLPSLLRKQGVPVRQIVPAGVR